ncbi:MAG: chromosomal replication initiator protein DnaA [Acidimicrobiales bacterium]
MTDPDQLWKSCSGPLRRRVGDAAWNTWFRGVHPAGGDAGSITLAVPAALIQARIETNFLPLITEELSAALGSPLVVRLVVDTDLSGDTPGDTWSDPWSDPWSEEEDEAPQVAREATRRESARSSGFTSAERPSAEGLNPAYTFSGFVTGSSNRFAEAAARAVADTPGSAYNPLFIYGGSGLGKTHLLHAIGNYVHAHFPHRRVLYVPTETFLNQFIYAIQTKAQSDLKRRYRDCDVLLVDDVDLLEGKEAFQEEFLYTLNNHLDNSTQIVLSADRAPKKFLSTDDRLRSRLLAGITTAIEPPELETRLAILGKKAEGINLEIPPEVLEFMGVNIRDNIRELEGALIRVTAFAILNSEPLTLALTEKLLADVVASNLPRQVTLDMILHATSELFDFTVDELRSPSRRRPLVTARQVGMYVCRQLTDHSYPTIAREFGGRDHTTVIHAVSKIAGLMAERRQIYDHVVELTRRLQE